MTNMTARYGSGSESEKSRPSRSVRPWELSNTYRPVWAYPVCPAGHGRIFVTKMHTPKEGQYRCVAPWCEETTFYPPDDWTDRLMAETRSMEEAGNGYGNADGPEREVSDA